MCGIFGLATASSEVISRDDATKIIAKLMQISESRGKESSGLAFCNTQNIILYKNSIPGSELVKSKQFQEVLSRWGEGDLGRAVIGHTRLVTNGSSEDNANNQPVVKCGIVGVHNGIIVNERQLWDANPDLQRNFEVDTEILFALVRKKIQHGMSMGGAVDAAIQEVDGTVSVAVLFDDRDELVLATNCGSLYFARDKEVLVFASEKAFLEDLFVACKALSRRRLRVEHLSAGQIALVDLGALAVSINKLSSRENIHEQNKVTAKTKRSIFEIQIKKETANLHTGPSYIENKQKELVYRKLFQEVTEQLGSLRRCTNCVLPSTVPYITFNLAGVCSVCESYIPHKRKGKDELEKKLSFVRSWDGAPDCAIMFSGGRDSSAGLHFLVKEFSMHPIAYTYDWGMITDLGRRNQARMCGELGIEHVLISADIRKKRENIRKNILAWVARPSLGMVPLFMAGDKHFFYYANQLRSRMGIQTMVMTTNPFEKTSFKSGFCGIPPRKHTYALSSRDTIQLAAFYAKEFLLNPKYVNSSIPDSFIGYLSYYFIQHDYLNLFDYIPWSEKEIDELLVGQYGWEHAQDTATTWRIGDGTAPFYNFVYHVTAGFTENDSLRSNQIREGMITRDEALMLIERDNTPRWESMRWYFDVLGIEMNTILKRVLEVPRLYDRLF